MAKVNVSRRGSTSPQGADQQKIILRGLRVNNLKNIDLDIPRNKFIVVTGVSGSGKSSLAFETLYAEGQRRYVESLSAYQRQFLGRMTKPESDLIRGIPPAVAIEQRVISRNPRSTVATSTEIYEYLRLLYARVGHMISPISGERVKKHTVADITKLAMELPEGTRFYLATQLTPPEGRSLKEHLEILLQQGYTRLFIDGGIVRIEDYLSRPEDYGLSIKLLLDRMVLDPIEERDDQLTRLADSAESAFYEGAGEAYVYYQKPEGAVEEQLFNNRFEADGKSFLELSPQLFSFNNPLGACPTCEGYGQVIGIDPNLVIPDDSKSVYEGCVAAWQGPMSSKWQEEFIRSSAAYNFPLHTPYSELPEDMKELLWEGIDSPYGPVGITPYFDMLRREMHKIQNRVRLAHFRGKSPCPKCKGSRLVEDALYVEVGGMHIDQLVKLPLTEAKLFFDNLKLEEHEMAIAERLLREIRSRIDFLLDVGLGYLTLDRPSNTLSGGESQRITLATQLGNTLVGSLYVLDEPSIGLHQRDTQRLIKVIKRLRDLGNTVVVVEHDEEVMRAADHLIDIGPLAGSLGGRVVYNGPLAEIIQETQGLTAEYLTGRLSIPTPESRRKWRNYIEILGAKKNNLKQLDVKIPLEVITVISGVSGSGKSTLVKELLYPALKARLENEPAKINGLRALEGSLGKLSAVEYVDQNNIGKSSRSNPVTYIGVYNDIRKLFSELPEAKRMGYQPYYFSFNKEGGRCEVCKGDGSITVEMQFMADLTLECEECHGKRFRKELLEISYHGKNISDILQMTIDEAIGFFNEYRSEDTLARKIADGLKPLQEVGLGYLQLGQSSSTLSGGENQRVKLASYLGKRSTEKRLFIFDEPTTGLHFADISVLMKAFQALVDSGHSVIIVEHNIEVIKSADYLIELGPEGGKGGGRIVAQGTPEEVALATDSPTAPYLREALGIDK